MNPVVATLLVAAMCLVEPFAPRNALAQHTHAAKPDSARTMHAMPGMADTSASRHDSASTHPAQAMDDMAERMAGVLGIPHTRLGSGTSWLPEASPHYGWHIVRGGWSLMVHGIAYAEYDRQLGTRGNDQFGSINWGMLMAMHSLWGGMLHLHGMMSAEPATIGSAGYPLLLQSGESYRGEQLHDRQHPHDLFMELSAMYEHPIAQNLALSLYAAPVGEPASGPVAFPHRPSAASDPLAPLGHHWQDATHITYGVLTLGMFSRTWKVEGSIFNGREPDEHRTDIETRRLDSYAARVFYNPTVSWSYSASMAYLASPEVLHPEESVHRYSASIMNTRLFGSRGQWSSSIIYGANAVNGAPLANSALAETDLSIDGVNTFFGRAEFVQKSAQDLAVADSSEFRHYNVGALTVRLQPRDHARAWAHARGVDPRHAQRGAGRARAGVRQPVSKGVRRISPSAPRPHAHGKRNVGDVADSGGGKHCAVTRRRVTTVLSPDPPHFRSPTALRCPAGRDHAVRAPRYGPHCARQHRGAH